MAPDSGMEHLIKDRSVNQSINQSKFYQPDEAYLSIETTGYAGASPNEAESRARTPYKNPTNTVDE